MKIRSFDVNMEAFGAEFAKMGSIEQAYFFKGLAAELRHFESCHHAEMQFCSIGNKLSAKDKSTLDVLVFLTSSSNEV